MKKSLYIFLSCILGVALFLILDRIIIFAYAYLITAGIMSASFVYGKFIFIDVFSLILSAMAGAWYGIWLGMNWYSQVYEVGSHGGFADHLAKKLWPVSKPKNLGSKLASVKEHLEKDLWQLESLAKSTSVEAEKPAPRVARAAVKRAPKKLNTLK